MLDVDSTIILQSKMPDITWNCNMRRNMQEIVPGLFLGPRQCRTNLVQNGITHIISVREAQCPDTSFDYLILDIADLATESIIKYFPKVRQFIDDAFAKDGRVLVNGNNGNSRSATLVLAYIMEKYGLNCTEAFRFVKTKRACIKPNEGFISQLAEYEPIYKARQNMEQGTTSCATNRQKRKSEHLSEYVDVDLIQPPPSPSNDYTLQSDYHQRQDIHDISTHLHRLWLLKS